MCGLRQRSEDLREDLARGCCGREDQTSPGFPKERAARRGARQFGGQVSYWEGSGKPPRIAGGRKRGERFRALRSGAQAVQKPHGPSQPGETVRAVGRTAA
ncbi:hypothetical protein GCM10009565_17590 [Amycolatopsis albidoflavus]